MMIARSSFLALLLAGAASAQQPPVAVQIAGLDDVALGTWTGIGDLLGMTEHCVMSRPSGAFALSASGDGSGGECQLASAYSSVICELDYDDGTGWRSIPPGSMLNGLTGVRGPGQMDLCLNGRRSGARLRVRIPETRLGGVPAGAYRGRVTLVVAPE